MSSESSYDIGELLTQWPYDPRRLNVRVFPGLDGRQKLQLRCVMGLLQMDKSGRPDGQRPFGFESLLHYHGHELQNYRRSNGNDAGFYLTPEECGSLRFEMQLYAQRAASLLLLGDYPAAMRDSFHNLRIADLCRRFGLQSHHLHVILGNRPRMLIMRARARASLLLEDGRPRAAYTTVQRLIRRLEKIYAGRKRRLPYACLPDLAQLQLLEFRLRLKLPIERVRMLRKALERAIAAGRYREAARLRKQIAALTTDDGRPPRPVDPR
ncbi:MAG: hypothetical protein ACK4PI_04910 [Tepidisphaerales bacterium]